MVGYAIHSNPAGRAKPPSQPVRDSPNSSHEHGVIADGALPALPAVAKHFRALPCGEVGRALQQQRIVFTFSDVPGTLLLTLGSELRRFVREHELGEVFVAPVDVVLADNDVVQPDVLFISRAREDRITDEKRTGSTRPRDRNPLAVDRRP